MANELGGGGTEGGVRPIVWTPDRLALSRPSMALHARRLTSMSSTAISVSFLMPDDESRLASTTWDSSPSNSW